MPLQVSGFSSFFRSSACANSRAFRRQPHLVAASFVLAAMALAGPPLAAQPVNRITQAVDTSRLQALPNHHPLWANPANSTGLAPADLALNQLTLVLARSAQQEQAFQQFIADQQNPASPDYHHWLTPAEVGDRFGLSDDDLATITAWLQSQGLHVTWVAPSRVFIGFSGTASDVGRAFQTQMRTYNVNGQQRLSVDSNPMLPAALTPAIKAIRGLYTINESPTHHVTTVTQGSPQVTTSNGSHYIGPGDFDTIYDVPASYTGAGITIGIVGWSRTNAADFDNFKSKTGVTFADPIEVVPTAYGGIDPGPALTAPPSGSGSSSALSGQSEATLDVTRAGSVAPGANLLLVVSSASGANDGIGADAQYLVNTSPVVQVMSISFGACESGAGSAGVAFWNTLFQTAVAEGISVFVSSGDSGAAGCDTAFSPPPSSPLAISPNYICSSSYATCVGGTQFADTASPSTYWSSTNTADYLSALSYIPEGAWNESSIISVAATGGGVSSYVATPSWQTGTGVPSARAGRYTPDVAFSASAHDGYFGCMAALNSSCVPSGGNLTFVVFSGTSAAAPGMAGVTALLDQKLGSAQGNLNPRLYPLATSTPTAFHDTTLSSSGVTSCSVSVASTCNNSITLLSGIGTQPGYLLTTGYDEVTGLGSLDVGVFLNNFPSSNLTPSFTVSGTALTISTPGATSANTSTISVTPVNGFTGSVTLSATVTGPSGAQHPPTLSFGSTSPVTITSSNGTATLTVSTTATQQSSCVAANQAPRPIPWYAKGSAVLACLLLFGIAPRWRNWRAMLGILLLFAALATGMSACGGGSQGTACTTTTTPGTTAGSYTITLTATSGSTTATSTIPLTIN
ncbi:MAG TPA: S53 family peptidase [Terracidiphilus sp.]|nr:S53 family peptidase [Terracidiphilus sp.]